jgi:lactoylglutathione lyase
MRIEHLAIWVKDLENMRQFYEKYFNATSNELYHNPQKQFSSYFLSFESGCRLELMHRPDIKDSSKEYEHQSNGIVHFAISVGSKDAVNALTERLSQANHTVASQPRTTGDGYYESVVLDPENNIIEITS